jgi:aminopeptidase N
LRGTRVQYKWRNAGTRDFEAVAERVSGKELTPFFDQWLYRGGIPRLKIKTDIGRETVIVTIEQDGPLFHFPIDLHVVMPGGTVDKHVVNVSQKSTSMKWDVKGALKVLVDPDTRLLFDRK